MAEFKHRTDSGEKLAEKLAKYKGTPDLIVVGLARGGVVTALPVAQALEAPLDCIVPRKIGAPDNPELAVGALTPDGEVLLNDRVMNIIKIERKDVEHVITAEREEATRRMRVYRGGRPPLNIAGKTVLVTDDGIATGSTMRATLMSLKKQNPKKLIVAVPISSKEAITYLSDLADEIVTVLIPERLESVHDFYDDFEQNTDDDVIQALAESTQNLKKEH